jgi:hypothetical protein
MGWEIINDKLLAVRNGHKDLLFGTMFKSHVTSIQYIFSGFLPNEKFVIYLVGWHSVEVHCAFVFL